MPNPVSGNPPSQNARVRHPSQEGGDRHGAHRSPSSPVRARILSALAPGLPARAVRLALAASLRARRAECGLIQRELAAMACVCREHLGRVEGARAAATVDTVARLASALGIRPADLLCGEANGD